MSEAERADARRTASSAGAPTPSAAAIAALVASVSRRAREDASLAGLLAEGASQVQRELAGLVLRTALALALEPNAPSSDLNAEAVARALAAFDELSERAGLSSPALLGTSSLLGIERVRTLLDDATLAALARAVFARHADGTERLRDPGEIHQELLEIGLVRLDASSFRFTEGGAWVPGRDVLAEAPELRSRWLQRTAALPKSAVQRYAVALEAARSEDDVIAALTARAGSGAAVAHAGELVVTWSEGRRRGGSHYTPAELRRAVVERTLAPLVDGAGPEAIRALRVCDPAMGAGDFLVEVATTLARKLVAASPITDGAMAAALRHVVTECVHGVDRDAIAVDLARWKLSRLVALHDAPTPNLSAHLKCGDALVGRGSLDAPREHGSPVAQETSQLSMALDASSASFSVFDTPLPAFDWPSAFPDALSRERGGFDACVGNPPWVAYAGRAAQPLDRALARYYERTNPAFHGYRTLHGLFVRRAAELLRPGGRLGLVLPTSVADLSGYAPTRAAHDALCDADPSLTDFGDGAFEGVFQPCMALTSTRRAHEARRGSATAESSRTTLERPSVRSSSGAPPGARGEPWSLTRTDLDDVGLRLLERLSALPPLDGALFGERGLQTTGSDLSHLRKLAGPEAPFVVPIREGTDLAELERHPPRTFLDPRGLTGRLRPAEEFARVEILIRQTARYPIAALSDGLAFRNSILAGFSSAEWTAPALVAYLNSSVVRWYHYARHRDARQGMPQLKIGHLRALPTIGDARARARLGEIGARFGARNAGLSPGERAELDAIVEDAHGISGAERELVRRFAVGNPPPVRRGAAPSTLSRHFLPTEEPPAGHSPKRAR